MGAVLFNANILTSYDIDSSNLYSTMVPHLNVLIVMF